MYILTFIETLEKTNKDKETFFRDTLLFLARLFSVLCPSTFKAN